MNDKIIYIIPAREGSKGLPHKNRRLIPYTIDAVGDRLDSVYISTDDPFISEQLKGTAAGVIKRPSELGGDDVSMKWVLLHAIDEIKPSDDTLVVCLYPTYPQRTTEHIDDAIAFFKSNNAKSLLCRKEYKGVSPYLMMINAGGHRGGQVITHNLYRRQDYPTVFEISHFIAITTVLELPKLNLNLYNHQTLFYPIGDVIDVDTSNDIIKFIKRSVKPIHRFCVDGM